MKIVSQFLLFLLVIILMSGCKLAVINVEGGEVQSDGSGACVGGSICIVEISDTSFSETFMAVPNTGWHLEKWNSGYGLLCGGKTGLWCEVSLEGTSGNAAIEKMVASSEFAYLMPVFKPDTDVVTVDGKQWLQPSFFENVSWGDINAICPGGPCTVGGILNGHDMTGWTWASMDDLNSLFNYYLGAELLGPGPGASGYSGREPGLNQNWPSQFFSDGWRPNFFSPSICEDGCFYYRGIAGWVAGRVRSGADTLIMAYLQEYGDASDSLGQVGVDAVSNNPEEQGEGAWFYRAL